MKISLNWIKDFIDLDTQSTIKSAKELAEAITLSTCEIEGWEETGTFLDDIKVAEVKSTRLHPEAEKLTLVTVDYGEMIEVVCGASNYKVGDKVAFAGLGVTLPGDFTIKKAKIRGIVSEGMLCAEDELGFSEDHEGLMILPSTAQIGQTLADLFPDQIDYILEVDNKSITHRPDLWGHYGFARELGAIYRKEVKPFPAKIEDHNKKEACPVAVSMEGGDLVYRYSGLALDNVQIGPSPLWMQHRLHRVGLRAINNAVDVTNYVMLDLGQPMHAFDLNKIAGSQLKIHPAGKGEKLMTLYEKEVELTEKDLLISDTNGPNVLAGVIGGMESGVSETTSQIFLEAANWDAVTVRKTTSRIGLRTDSSQRFEKTLDPEMTTLAIARAIDLFKLTCPEITANGGLTDQRGNDYAEKIIQVQPAFIQKRLGKDLPAEEIKDILTRLGFVIAGDVDWIVTVPTFRATKDVAIPEDLVEEIGRIHGFNNIPPKAPVFPIKRAPLNNGILLQREVQSLLSDNGFHEVYCYPMTTASVEAPFQLPTEGVMRMINPVSDQQDQMRTSLLPHMAARVRELQKETLDFGIFELGRTYYKNQEGKVKETNQLLIALSKSKGETGDAFYQLKATLTRLMNAVKVEGSQLTPIEALKVYQHKYISAAISAKTSQGQDSLGSLYQLTPAYTKGENIKGEVAFAEINLDRICSREIDEFKYQEVSKYPPVHFELSVVTPERTSFQTLHDIIKGASKRVSHVGFIGLYDLGDQTGSMSISMEFKAAEKTLEPDEIKALQDKMIIKLEKAGYPLR